jgi:hypothetical protein
VTVPEAAITAAQMADGDVIHRWTGGLPDARVRRMLEAAAPLITAAERGRVSQRFLACFRSITDADEETVNLLLLIADFLRDP